MIKRLLLCLFLLAPITAQAEIITEHKPPEWIVKCWNPADQSEMSLETFKHYTNGRPNFASETWIRINEGKTGEWTWIFALGVNLVCKIDKVLERQIEY